MIVLLVVTYVFAGPVNSHAKKKKKSHKKQDSSEFYNHRIDSLSPDDRRRFNALSSKQQQAIREGRIEPGFNEWMAKLALGDPFYGTEHHPIFTDYEQVWLYTKVDVDRDVSENKIIDPQTNWPTIHRIEKIKKCTIGDYFVLWDRGVVESIKPDNSHKQYGKCTIETQESFLPIVDGKPVSPKKK